MWCNAKNCRRGARRNLVALALFWWGVVPATTAHGQDSSDTLATLDTVYVASAGKTWFVTWLEEKEQSEGPLFRPQIKEASGEALLQMVKANPASVGLLSRSELQAMTPVMSGIRSAASGQQVCMAIAVRQDATTAEIGDLALLPEAAKIVATGDTMTMLRSVLDVHHLGQHLSVLPASRSDAIAGLSAGAVAAASLPIEPGGDAQHDDVDGLKFLSLTDAAADAAAGAGFVAGSFSPSRILGVSLASSIKTICDDVMIVSSASSKFAPERLGRKDETSQVTARQDDGLLDRVSASLNDLWSVIVARYQGIEQ